MDDYHRTKRSSFRQDLAPVRNLLTPPNPIITKNIESGNQRANFKVDSSKITQESMEYRPKAGKLNLEGEEETEQRNKKKQGITAESTVVDSITLSEEYDKSRQIFIKYNNHNLNKRGNKQFIASIFLPIETKRIKLPQYKGTLRDDQLIFDSNFQSANLMSVFKTGQNSYDLLLQNDVNTSGFTQWFNFKVTNKRNNFIAKFNIVNLYKSKSLYNIGMKPIVHSQRSDRQGKNTWRRKGFNIFYEKNDLNYEDNPRKCYKTLSFQYDFTTENDTVQFAHAMPYDYNDLQKLLGSIKGSPKVSMKQIGVTLMNKPITLVKIGSFDNIEGVERKAIIVLARQHPGETPGSFIVEQIINQLLRHSIEVDFLTWRFDIYIFPMVNIDGVVLGNYRGNFAGYDLNRCWLKTDQDKQPQVYAIKNYIKKISKKQYVELILDLHGHSRKLGSFFYGNNFGKSPMLFPFVASRANNNILFDECKFSTEKAAKASTARVVLGNIIKETGNVYTYEVSFYGNYKNNQGNVFSFNEDHYKQLGKALVLSMYRTYMEMYKQEKTLKESVYLKNIKKQIQDFSFSKAKQDSESGSDSQASQAMKEERQQLQQFFKPFAKKMDSSKELGKSVNGDSGMIRGKNNSDYRLPVQKNNQQIKRKISQLLEKNSNQDNKSNIIQRLPSIYQKQQQKNENFSRLEKSLQLDSDFSPKVRKSNGNRLKIYGQTFQLRSRFQFKNSPLTIDESNEDLTRKQSKKFSQKVKNESKEYNKQRKQLLKSFNTIAYNDHRSQIGKQAQINEEKLYRKYKNRNNSLTLKEVTPVFSDQMVNDVVKINKLNYLKLKEENQQTKQLIEQMAKRNKLPVI